MMKSMTGFGKAQAAAGNKKINVEIRSLNSKQFDLNVRIPSVYREKELTLRSVLNKKLTRGKVDLSLYIEEGADATSVKINKELALKYAADLKLLATELNEEVNLLPLLIKMPDVMKTQREELDEKEWEVVLATIDKAMDALNQYREDEGAQLHKEIKGRIDNISDLLLKVEAADPKRKEAVREKIMNNFKDADLSEKIDQNRLEQELIYYLEKMDITEEKVRLKTHCEYFLKTMETEAAGRKLNFITQEIGREINTIGSKAADADMQKNVVMMKDELEKIKEQSLNIL